jgi:nucleotide-binding universal stress UspA family protein
MLKIEKILSATDFSEPSFYALKFANEFAVHFNAELVVINVVPPIPITSTPPPFTAAGVPGSLDLNAYRQSLVESAQKELMKIIEKYIAPQLKITTVVEYGDPAERILYTAEKSKVDLIVISTHGRSGWRQFIFGSVAEKIIRIAKQPVLTVRKLN